MRVLSLFSGIGGLDLAAEWAGFEIAALCEINPFSVKVLNKNWPGIPVMPDVTKLNKKTLEEAGVISNEKTIDVITGGFPCQPYSIAGKRRGKDDDRDLWPEMFRIIRELKPTWIVGENVANFVGMELERTITDLESEGYEIQTFVIPACGVNAKHKRYRTFVVAYSNDRYKSKEKEVFSRRDATRTCGSTLRNTYSESKSQADKSSSTVRSERETREGFAREYRRETSRTYWSENKPPVCGVADGFSTRMDKDRLIALGNAVVPQQVYPIFEAIMKIGG